MPSQSLVGTCFPLSLLELKQLALAGSIVCCTGKPSWPAARRQARCIGRCRTVSDGVGRVSDECQAHVSIKRQLSQPTTGAVRASPACCVPGRSGCSRYPEPDTGMVASQSPGDGGNTRSPTRQVGRSLHPAPSPPPPPPPSLHPNPAAVPDQARFRLAMPASRQQQGVCAAGRCLSRRERAKRRPGAETPRVRAALPSTDQAFPAARAVTRGRGRGRLGGRRVQLPPPPPPASRVIAGRTLAERRPPRPELEQDATQPDRPACPCRAPSPTSAWRSAKSLPGFPSAP